MSGTVFVTIDAVLRASTPADVLEWLRRACTGHAPPVAFAVDDFAAGMIGETPWFLGLDGGARIEPWHPGWLVTHHTRLGLGDGTGLQALYGTMLLLAPYCSDGVAGAEWTEFAARPSVFLVQDGTLFTAAWGRTPVAVASSATPPVVWKDGRAD